MNPMLNIAIRAARKAGDLIIRALDQVHTLELTQKGPYDYVTEIDQRAEREIIHIIHRSYPQHGILAEESGSTQGNEYTWIIDPLDGTKNFIYGLPHFCVSIALQYRGRIEHGVIYDPIRQELFTALRGSGARLNDRRIRVKTCRQLEGALIGTDFPYPSNEKSSTLHLEAFNKLLPVVGGLRSSGSAALDLAYLAAGRYDGFWEMGLKPWDIAAGILLIQEAGGLIADINGDTSSYFESGNIVAGNTHMLKALLKHIGGDHGSGH